MMRRISGREGNPEASCRQVTQVVNKLGLEDESARLIIHKESGPALIAARLACRSSGCLYETTA